MYHNKVSHECGMYAVMALVIKRRRKCTQVSHAYQE